MPLNLRPASLHAFGSALRTARRAARDDGFTLDQLAAATGISKPYLSNIETGRTPGPPSEEKLKLLAKALDLPAADLLAAADWLRTPTSIRQAILGAAPPRRADGAIDLDRLMGPDRAQGPGQEDKEKRRQGEGENCAGREGGAAAGNTFPHKDILTLKPVPLINRVAAGKAGEFGDLSYPAGVADAYVAAPDLPETPTAALFAVRVVGDSMLPEYREGDILIVGPAREGDLRDGDDCVVRLGELENFATTFKRVFYLKDPAGTATAARLLPLNPAHQERIVQLQDVTGIYPLVYRLTPARAPAKPAKGKASEKLKS